MSEKELLRQTSHTPGVSDLPHHTPGTMRGEEWVAKKGREQGRQDGVPARTARDSTSINAAHRDPIDPRMPYIPPA